MLARRELKKMAKEQIRGGSLLVFLVISLLAPIVIEYVFSRISGIVTLLLLPLNSKEVVDTGIYSLSKTVDPDIQARIISNMFPFILQVISIAISVGFVMSLIKMFIVGPLNVSRSYAYLEAANGRKPEYSMISYGFENCWVKAGLLTILENIFIVLWSLLFIIPGIVKAFAYSMAEFIIAENPDISPLDAITKSKEMMKGHKFELFVLGLSFFWWALLVVITFGIASIYVLPYIQATQANFYLKLKEEQGEASVPTVPAEPVKSAEAN